MGRSWKSGLRLEKKSSGKSSENFLRFRLWKKFRIKRADNACVFARTVVSLNYFYKNFRENETGIF